MVARGNFSGSWRFASSLKLHNPLPKLVVNDQVATESGVSGSRVICVRVLRKIEGGKKSAGRWGRAFSADDQERTILIAHDHRAGGLERQIGGEERRLP